MSRPAEPGRERRWRARGTTREKAPRTALIFWRRLSGSFIFHTLLVSARLKWSRI